MAPGGRFAILGPDGVLPMPTLDVRGVPVIGGLKANYHSTRQPTPLQLKRLHDCLELAKLMASHAATATRNMIWAITGGTAASFFVDAVTKEEAAILMYHFRLPKLDTAGGDGLELWKPHLERVRRVYDEVSTYLNQPLTISDAYSGELNPAPGKDGKGYVAPKRAVREGRDQGRDQVGKEVIFLEGLRKEVRENHNVLFDEYVDYVDKQFMYEPKHFGSIHIKFSILDDKYSQEQPNLYIARCLLHEATHKACDTTDNAYAIEEEKYKQMTTWKALDNADSYAWAALCFFKKNMLVLNAVDGKRKQRAGLLDLTR